MFLALDLDPASFLYFPTAPLHLVSHSHLKVIGFKIGQSAFLVLVSFSTLAFFWYPTFCAFLSAYSGLAWLPKNATFCSTTSCKTLLSNSKHSPCMLHVHMVFKEWFEIILWNCLVTFINLTIRNFPQSIYPYELISCIMVLCQDTMPCLNQNHECILTHK